MCEGRGVSDVNVGYTCNIIATFVLFLLPAVFSEVSERGTGPPDMASH